MTVEQLSPIVHRPANRHSPTKTTHPQKTANLVSIALGATWGELLNYNSRTVVPNFSPPRQPPFPDQKSPTKPPQRGHALRSEQLGTVIRVSPKNIRKFKDRVKEITRRKRGVSIESRQKELREYFTGWVGYFRAVPIKSFFAKLDKWVRRRVLACYWKQWRKPKTKVAKLLKLGVSREQACSHGNSSRGAWITSSSRAVHQALSMQYLTESGLTSLLTVWTKFACEHRTA